MLCAHQDYNTLSTIDFKKRLRKRVDFRLDRGHIWDCRPSQAGLTVSGVTRSQTGLVGFEEDINIQGLPITRQVFNRITGYPISSVSLASKERCHRLIMTQSLGKDFTLYRQEESSFAHLLSVKGKQCIQVRDDILAIRDMTDSLSLIILNLEIVGSEI